MIEGFFFDGHSSRAYPATLQHSPGGLVISVGGELYSADKAQVTVRPPLGSTRRVLLLAGGARFETDDQTGISALEREWGVGKLERRVHSLERLKYVALPALLLTVLSVGFMSTYGLTALARLAAARTPVAWLERLDSEVVETLGSEFSPTSVSTEEQRELEARFERLVNHSGAHYPFSLTLVESDWLGANAFALPGGSIYMTDDLYALLTPLEREAVLAHEIAHVVHQDGLVSLYRSLGLVALVSIITGDLIGPTTVAAGLPVLLLKNGYSQQAEFAADAYAARMLFEKHGSSAAMKSSLKKISRELEGEISERSNYFSTHPATGERIRRLEALP